tara:strand:+ start:2662 stop:3741 length:1080 start_codon:yes stop_codon:yes gene_type:complete
MQETSPSINKNKSLKDTSSSNDDEKETGLKDSTQKGKTENIYNREKDLDNSSPKEVIDLLNTNDQNQTSKELEPFINIALEELIKKRNTLKNEIVELTKRKGQIENELKSSFPGQSDAIARRLKGFKDYLTGAFEDLVQSAEQLELVAEPVIVKPSPLDKVTNLTPEKEVVEQSTNPVADTFKPDEELIRDCLDQFLEQPDFYADAWKFRRSLESKDIEVLSDWFFSMGGRGAQPSRGNRSKNILVAAALVAILGELYGDRFQTLILASQPERLGEWRRGLQDALGLGREDFGPNSGIMLFERGDGLVEKADRLEERGDVPLILIDAAEQSIDIPILQFPIWLAFAASPEEIYSEEELI